MMCYITRSYFGLIILAIMLLFLLMMQFLVEKNTNADPLLHSFRQNDMNLVDEVLNLDLQAFTEKEAMHKFYWLIAFPVQGVCRILKRIGGKWVKRQVDGDKFVCMDNIVQG